MNPVRKNRFESQLVDHINHGADWLCFTIKCKSVDGYIYTLEDFTVNRDECINTPYKSGSDDALFESCMVSVRVSVEDIHKSIVKDGVVYSQNEMRIIGAKNIKDIWVDISFGKTAVMQTEESCVKPERGIQF